MLQSSQKEGETEDLHFISTQMQARHEDLSEKETRQRNVRRKVLQLGLFRNEKDPTPEPSIQRKSLPKPKLKPKRKSSKISSINAFVRETLGNGGLELHPKERPSQALILLYFSGDKKKVDALLSKIEHEEDLNSRGIDSSLAKNDHPQIFYTKDEWKYVIDNIKLRFPNLSSKTKKTLKGINKRMQMSQSLREEAFLLGIWSQASALPDNELSPDDIRWLYDLDEEQMANNQSMIEDSASTVESDQFVMTLSQALNGSDGLRSVEYRHEEATFAEEIETEGDEEGMVDQTKKAGPSGAPSKRRTVEEIAPEECVKETPSGVSLEDKPSRGTFREDFPHRQESLFIDLLGKEQLENSPEELLDEVPDSSSDIEILEITPGLLPQQHSFNRNNDSATPFTQKDNSATPFPGETESAHQKEASNFDTLTSLVFAKTLPEGEGSQKPKFDEIFSSPARPPTLQVILSRAGTQAEPIDLEHDSPLPQAEIMKEKISSSLIPSKKDDDVITSSPIVLVREIAFKTPSKWPNAIPKMSPLSSPIRLPFFTSIKQSKATIVDELEISSSSDEADYSTARPFVTEEEPELAESPAKDDGLVLPSAKLFHATKKITKRKTYKTSTIEVRGNFTLDASLLEDPRVKVRMVGPKVISLDSDEEVRDSEDDQDISIVEITRELDDTDALIDAGKEEEPELQVPSSPDAGSGVLRMLPSEDSFDTVFSFGAKANSQVKERELKEIFNGDVEEETRSENEVDSRAPFDENSLFEGEKSTFEGGNSPSKGERAPLSSPSDVNVSPETDFTALSVPQLRQQLKKWGLKPVSGKLHMVRVLQNASKLMEHSQLCSQLGATRMFNSLTSIIRKNDYWFSRVASFEPIFLEELQRWLAEQNTAVELHTLAKYCDKMGISTTSRGS